MHAPVWSIGRWTPHRGAGRAEAARAERATRQKRCDPPGLGLGEITQAGGQASGAAALLLSAGCQEPGQGGFRFVLRHTVAHLVELLALAANGVDGAGLGEEEHEELVEGDALLLGTLGERVAQ
jgi:hypothetical protein